MMWGFLSLFVLWEEISMLVNVWPQPMARNWWRQWECYCRWSAPWCWWRLLNSVEDNSCHSLFLSLVLVLFSLCFWNWLSSCLCWLIGCCYAVRSATSISWVMFQLVEINPELLEWYLWFRLSFLTFSWWFPVLMLACCGQSVLQDIQRTWFEFVLVCTSNIWFLDANKSHCTLNHLNLSLCVW